MPFLVDSVVSALGGFDRGVRIIVHPQMNVTRTVTGELVEVLTDPSTPVPDAVALIRESWMHLEIDRLPDAAIPEVEARLRHVLDNVRDAVEDWPKMRAHALTIASDLKAATPPGHHPHEAREASRFLEWLSHNNFTFLGYREYSLRHEDGKDISRQVPGTGLGTASLRPAAGGHRGRSSPRPRVGPLATRPPDHHQGQLAVHRPPGRLPGLHLDQEFDARGECVGEQRFLGLYASGAYNDSIHDIPLLDVRAQDVLR